MSTGGQGRLAKNNRRFDNGEIDFLLGDVLASARLADLAWDELSIDFLISG